MPKKKPGLYFCFFLAFLLQLMQPALFPSCKINFLVIPLVISFYFVSKSAALWLSLLCGAFIDCLCSHARIGMTATAYILAALILYEYRLYFFKEAISTLFIMTYLFSCLSSLIEVMLYLFLSSSPFRPSFNFIAIDSFLMPLLDGAIAFLLFSLPHMMYTKYHKYKLYRKS